MTVVSLNPSPLLTVYRFAPEKDLQVIETQAPADIFPLQQPGFVTWLNVDGIENQELVETICSELDIHPLVVEDILHTRQRPKIEPYSTFLFLVLNMFSWDADSRSVDQEQVSFIVAKDTLITFQEDIKAGKDVFDGVRARLQNPVGHLRLAGLDFLLYSLIDAVVDEYFTILDKYGEVIEDLEEENLTNPDTGTIERIHTCRRQLFWFRKSVWPLRDVVVWLSREDVDWISDAARLYLRDVSDHVLRILDTLETYREMVMGLVDVHLSMVSNRLNDVMKVLTIISTLFIPVSFITGLYGMNFVNMPELQWRYGYYVVLGVIGVVLLLMLWYFRRRKWL
ncbi:MAG: magnesium/cobalt transporter CorA [Anaerolineales bacterium]|nr:magnesium/cobalt transporter CorA [Anaerolineales bacterium]